MPTQTTTLNNTVTQFLDDLNHPFRNEIEQLRTIILSACDGLTENIKWNAPNYCFNQEDRITMRIHPPKKQVQLIFHRGATKQAQPREKLIEDNTGLLAWKENDRAIMTFKNMTEIEKSKPELTSIINAWIEATV
jgi:hypothetical protein